MNRLAVDKKSVLIIDDNAVLKDILREVLEPAGVEISCVDDGDAAIDMLEKKTFGVFIVDYRLPTMNGAEVTRNLRSRCPASRIIGISVQSKEKDFLDAGADVFLLKPFNVQELRNLIAQ
jgi:DNA-binding response OmpR family regulator